MRRRQTTDGRRQTADGIFSRLLPAACCPLFIFLIASGVWAQMVSAPTTPEQVERVIKQQPRDYELRLQAASFYMRQGQYAAAIPHLQAATRLRPKEVFAWVGLGDAQALAGRLKEARASYQRALAIAPKEPLAYRGLGELYLREKQFAKAKETFRKGLALSPDSLDLLLSSGNLSLIMNEIQPAVKYLEKAVRLAPNDAEVHHLLGEAYERNRHLNAALQENLTAIRLNPFLEEAYGRIGLYHIKLTHYQQARPYLQRAIQLDPKESHYYWALGDSYLFDLKEPKRYDKAIELYEKALKLDRNNSHALYSMGMALARRGRKEDLRRAIPYFERLTRLEPATINPYYKLFDIYRRLGDPKKAEKYLRLFEERSDKGREQLAQIFRSKSFLDTAEAHVRLGNRCLKEGRLQLALKEFQFALDRNPNLPAAREGLKQTQQRLAKQRSTK